MPAVKYSLPPNVLVGLCLQDVTSLGKGEGGSDNLRPNRITLGPAVMASTASPSWKHDYYSGLIHLRLWNELLIGT